jgi:hypothetical protein
MKNLLLLIGSLSFVYCGKGLRNQNIPHPVTQDMGLKSEQGEFLHQKWLKLAQALKIEPNTAQPKEWGPSQSYDDASKKRLEESLTKPSGYFLPENRQEYKDLLNKVTQRFTGKIYATRCSRVVNIEPWSPKEKPKRSEDFDLYRFSYKLMKNKEGEEEDITRSALLSIPKKNGQFPLMVYAHGGDHGLSYDREIGPLLGSYQKDNLILAPTFPGEPWCEEDTDPATPLRCNAKGTVSEPVGPRSPWDGDVDEFLGAQDCLIQALSAQRLIAQKTAMIQTALGTPYPSIFYTGSSRGGLVVSIALAKAGAQWKAFAGGDWAFPSGAPPMVHSAAWIGSPASVLVGELRVILEWMVKDQLKFTIGKELPGLSDLESLFQSYREDRKDSKILLDEAVMEIVSRDAIFLTPLILGALKRWDQPSAQDLRLSPGRMLVLHGHKDKVVPYSQSLAFFVAMQQFHQEPEVRREGHLNDDPLSMIYRAFRNARDKEGNLPPMYQHFDDYFRESQSYLPTQKISELSIPVEALGKLYSKSASEEGKTPQKIYRRWRNTF